LKGLFNIVFVLVDYSTSNNNKTPPY